MERKGGPQRVSERSFRVCRWLGQEPTWSLSDPRNWLSGTAYSGSHSQSRRGGAATTGAPSRSIAGILRKEPRQCPGCPGPGPLDNQVTPGPMLAQPMPLLTLRPAPPVLLYLIGTPLLHAFNQVSLPLAKSETLRLFVLR